MTNYNIVSNEKELKWFFDNVIVPPKIGESYLVCLSARSKKLSKEEREGLGLNRAEMMRKEFVRLLSNGTWDFNQYKKILYRYNCDERSLLSNKGYSYPSKCLVCYTYVNPSNELQCISDAFSYFNKIQAECINSCKTNNQKALENSLYQISKTFSHFKSSHAKNISRRIWKDFDIDLINTDFESRKFCLSKIYDTLTTFFQIGNFVIIETSGGYHCLVKVTSIKNNPNIFIQEVINQCQGKIKEIILTQPGSQFVPVPGTLQYGNLVTVVNKKDFN